MFGLGIVVFGGVVVMGVGMWGKVGYGGIWLVRGGNCVECYIVFREWL